MNIIAARKWARRNWWKAGLLSIAGWTAFFVAVLAPMNASRKVAESKASGLAAVAEWEPMSLWPEPAWHSVFSTRRVRLPEQRVFLQSSSLRLASVAGISGKDSSVDDDERKTVRTATLELEVKNPAESAEKIRQLAGQLGGFVTTSEISGSQDAPGAAVTLRVPALRFEEARREIKRLATRVENEKAEANDVTKDYVDREARLHNLRAQEAQYLSILRRATSVKDTLEVSEKLGEVRGQIEQQQAEFVALAKQVETVAIAVSLRAEADAQVFGIHWRPLYQLKFSARDGLENLADYAASMTTALFRLPAVLLWLATIIFAAAIGWRITRWAWKRFFASQRPAIIG